MTEQQETRQFIAEGWARCHCGKERHVLRSESTQALADSMLRLAQMGVCRACEADHHRRADLCPEAVCLTRGVASCKLAWNHLGRCEPITSAVDLDVMLARALAVGPPSSSEGGSH